MSDPEKLMKALLESVRRIQPSIVFMNRIDLLCIGRTRVLSQMLQMMDGLLSKPEDRIVVLGATNRPWDIDSAMLRRFDKRILVPLPDYAARKEIFEITFRKKPNFKLADDVDLSELAELTEGYTGDDIKKLCMDAWHKPLNELKQQNMIETGTPRPVARKDFLEVLQMRKTPVSPEEVRLNEEWAKKYGTDYSF